MEGITKNSSFYMQKWEKNGHAHTKGLETRMRKGKYVNSKLIAMDVATWCIDFFLKIPSMRISNKVV